MQHLPILTQRKKEDSTYLRSYKVSSVARGHEQAVVGTQLLSEAKVTDPDRIWIPRLINIEDIARLQVSVHHLEEQNRK